MDLKLFSIVGTSSRKAHLTTVTAPYKIFV